MFARLAARLTLLFGALALGASCSPARDDRHALLDAIDRAHDAISAEPSDPRAARAAVETLEGVRVRRELTATRDQCARLYAALLAHGDSFTEGKALLDRYERIPREAWPAGTAARMRDAYAAAESAAALAARAQPACEESRAALRRDLSTGSR